MDYKIIVGSDYHDVEKQVNEMLELGYVPIGSVQTVYDMMGLGKVWVFQAMLLDDRQSSGWWQGVKMTKTVLSENRDTVDVFSWHVFNEPPNIGIGQTVPTFRLDVWGNNRRLVWVLPDDTVKIVDDITLDEAKKALRDMAKALINV